MAKYYQDNIGNWHELPSEEYEYLLTRNHQELTFTSKTQVEYDTATAHKPPTPQEQRDAIQSQINTLERQQLMPRLSRDIYLALMLKEAATSGLTEPQLYLANIGYARLKDFDAVINGLRAQMDAIV